MKRTKGLVLFIALGVLMGTSAAVWGDGGAEPKAEVETYWVKGEFTANYTDFDQNGVPQAYSIHAKVNFKWRKADGKVKPVFKQIMFTSKRGSQDISICDFTDAALLAHYSSNEELQEAQKTLLEQMVGKTNADKWMLSLKDVEMDPYKSKNCNKVHGAQVGGTFLLQLEKNE